MTAMRFCFLLLLWSLERGYALGRPASPPLYPPLKGTSTSLRRRLQQGGGMNKDNGGGGGGIMTNPPTRSPTLWPTPGPSFRPSHGRTPEPSAAPTPIASFHPSSIPTAAHSGHPTQSAAPTASAAPTPPLYVTTVHTLPPESFSNTSSSALSYTSECDRGSLSYSLTSATSQLVAFQYQLELSPGSDPDFFLGALEEALHTDMAQDWLTCETVAPSSTDTGSFTIVALSSLPVDTRLPDPCIASDTTLDLNCYLVQAAFTVELIYITTTTSSSSSNNTTTRRQAAATLSDYHLVQFMASWLETWMSTIGPAATTQAAAAFHEINATVVALELKGFTNVGQGSTEEGTTDTTPTNNNNTQGDQNDPSGLQQGGGSASASSSHRSVGAGAVTVTVGALVLLVAAFFLVSRQRRRRRRGTTTTSQVKEGLDSPNTTAADDSTSSPQLQVLSDCDFVFGQPPKPAQDPETPQDLEEVATTATPTEVILEDLQRTTPLQANSKPKRNSSISRFVATTEPTRKRRSLSNSRRPAATKDDGSFPDDEVGPTLVADRLRERSYVLDDAQDLSTLGEGPPTEAGAVVPPADPSAHAAQPIFVPVADANAKYYRRSTPSPTKSSSSSGGGKRSSRRYTERVERLCRDQEETEGGTSNMADPDSFTTSFQTHSLNSTLASTNTTEQPPRSKRSNGSSSRRRRRSSRDGQKKKRSSHPDDQEDDETALLGIDETSQAVREFSKEISNAMTMLGDDLSAAALEIKKKGTCHVLEFCDHFCKKK